jgi:hypothetical protein
LPARVRQPRFGGLLLVRQTWRVVQEHCRYVIIWAPAVDYFFRH